MDSKTIATIQAAGTALHDAQTALARDGQRCAEQVREALGQDAFSVANDGLFEQWKSISRLSQSLAAMEAQLKDLYFVAVELAATGSTVSRTTAAPRLALAAAPAARGRGAGDVVDVELATPRKIKRRSTAPAAPAVAKSTTPQTPRLRGNAVSALAFLQARLDRDRFTRLTQAELAEGVPMALGSVGNTIAILKNKGLLVEGERGSYRLA
jgi:hypothetical protein